MSDPAVYYSNLRRGQMLRESARYQDACKFLGDAIQSDPEQPQAYLELALAQSQLPLGKKKSLETMERAVSLSPHSAHFQGYKAYLLGNFDRHKEALKVAEHALGIDPCCHIALLSKGNAHTKMAQWTQAEHTARRMLELDAEDAAALNLLAQSLRFQDRIRESHEVTSQILARIPEDSFAQANAGWEALKADDHILANKHFLTALRVDPTCEYARGGYLQSLRSRVWLYRVNLKIITGIAGAGDKLGKLFGAAVFLSGGLLLIPILVYVAVALTLQPLSNFFLLFDPNARQSLKSREMRWAYFTGAIASILLLLLALWGLTDWVIGIAVYLFLFAVSVYLPIFADCWQRWREERIIAAENAL